MRKLKGQLAMTTRHFKDLPSLPADPDLIAIAVTAVVADVAVDAAAVSEAALDDAASSADGVVFFFVLRALRGASFSVRIDLRRSPSSSSESSSWTRKRLFEATTCD